MACKFVRKDHHENNILCALTNDEIDLRSKLKREPRVAHELVHFQRLDYSALGHTLNANFSIEMHGRYKREARTP